MAKYVLWRICAVKLVQGGAIFSTFWLVWYLTALLLNAILGGLANPDGDVFNMEYSQVLAFVLVVFGVVIVRVIRAVQRMLLPHINGRMYFWALDR